MRLHLIFARAANGVIGKDGTMPWRLPEDMAHFKRTTMDAPVIMGRKTWDSILPKYRPLVGRENIVVTRQSGWQAAGVVTVHSLEEAIAHCARGADRHPDVWVMGGAQIYAQALPLAHTAAVTEIEAVFEGDAFAPEFGPQWKEVARERHRSATGLDYSFVTLRNTQQGN